jgi:hypothetical protein
MFVSRAITLSALIGGVLALAATIVYGNGWAALVAAFLFTLSLALWRYGYILIPMLTRAANVIEVRGGYEIPPGRDHIIKKTPSGYYAAKFLEIRFYESSMDKSETEKTSMFESFEKAISALKYVVKISLLISALDLTKHIDEIKTKRSAAEARKAKGGGSSDEAVRLDREIAKWNRLLDRITHGERPVEVIAFASTTAFGITRDEAVGRVSRQAKEIKTILSSSLGCDIQELADLDMLRCFEWEQFFPTTQEEIKDEIF